MPQHFERGPTPRAEAASPHVLLVEDDPSTREMYRTILEHAGYGVTTVGDGVRAVGCARQERPDVILMDINLPGQDGWEATRQLKEAQGTREIPVVGISASGGRSDHERARRLGFEAYHTKPFLPTQVLAEVQRVLGGGSGI